MISTFPPSNKMKKSASESDFTSDRKKRTGSTNIHSADPLNTPKFLPLGAATFFGMPNSDSESEFIISTFLGFGVFLGLGGVSDGAFAAN